MCEFLLSIQKRTPDPAVLILDNPSIHRVLLEDPKGQVRLLLLPPNCMSPHQSMDMGVLASIASKLQIPTSTKNNDGTLTML